MKSNGFIALTPLVVFVVMYLGTSLLAGDFYKMPISIAFLVTAIYTVGVVAKGKVEQRVSDFCKGAANENMMIMILIFILAGGFAASAKEMGAIDATVNCTLRFLPASMIYTGLFLASCFVSLSIGTSVGTIAALVPIATGIAQQTGSPVAYVTAIVVGGAFFGDNLSLISDTTIMATRTQGCQMKDKFKANLWIALPAAIVVAVIYLVAGSQTEVANDIPEVAYYKVLPYVTVLVAALMGMNVMMVLTIGILMCGGIGVLDGSYDVFAFMAATAKGIEGMNELIVVTLLAGGILGVIKKEGGIDYIISKLSRRVKKTKGAEMTIAALVSIVNVCTANNTIAILTVGNIAHRISEKYGVDPKRSASILDTCSCIVQGILPYGAQLLIASGLAHVSPVEIIPNLYYPMALAIVVILSITTKKK